MRVEGACKPKIDLFVPTKGFLGRAVQVVVEREEVGRGGVDFAKRPTDRPPTALLTERASMVGCQIPLTRKPRLPTVPYSKSRLLSYQSRR